MTDTKIIKELAAGSVRNGNSDCWSGNQVGEFLNAASNPAAVLELVAEIEQAKADGADAFGLAQARADQIDQLKAENTDLHATLKAAKGEIERLKGENEELHENVRLSNLIIAERNRLLDMFDCPMHGQCVPHAMDEVLSLCKDARRYRFVRSSTSMGKVDFCVMHVRWGSGQEGKEIICDSECDERIDCAMSKESSHG